MTSYWDKAKKYERDYENSARMLDSGNLNDITLRLVEMLLRSAEVYTKMALAQEELECR